MLELNDAPGERATLFVDVLLPLPISGTYTYRVPASMQAMIIIGKRVTVQFGKSRIYTGVVYATSLHPPLLYEAKYILDVLDEYPIVTSLQLKLWEWMAAYYLCSPGEVMQAALPAALKLASETKIVLLQEGFIDKASLSDKEFLIVDALSIQPELKVSDICKLLGQKSVFPLLKGLFEKGVIHISEEVTERYKPRLKTFLILGNEYLDPDNLKALFSILERSPKQLSALMGYLKLSREGKEVSKAQLLEVSDCGNAAIRTLLDKEVFRREERAVSRLYSGEGVEEEPGGFTLSPQQQQALTDVEAGFGEKDTVLLHGVTSSGKTLVYVRLISEMIRAGKTCLYLLPEIALTTQVIERLRVYFGGNIGIYHSKFSDNERAETWYKVLKGEYKVILGARSAVLLPFGDLGLIIVDEEHDPSYKQFDPAPRYHARDTAIYLAGMHGAKVLLGSATPSIESYHNARSGRYGLAELGERFGKASFPDIGIVSIPEELKRKTMQSHFTSVLVQEIGAALQEKQQVILFQNRRGHTSFLLCKTCGYTPKCINCDVSLTYHRSTDRLHCHYCGYKQETPPVCPVCGSAEIIQKGFGTEKIEDDLALLFPEARIDRLDFDSTRTKNSFQKILANLGERKTDVLVGTQMITKGLDFDHITLIGIVNADSLLNYPDFRAYERSYQLLSQVAGRAGRREKKGKVLIQAYDTRHRVLRQVIAHDYTGMYLDELEERKKFGYPPFTRLIRLDVKHKGIDDSTRAANRLASELRSRFGSRIIGPEPPLIAKVRNYYIQSIMIKAKRPDDSIVKIKQALEEALIRFAADKENKGTLIRIDVDPY
jgi:primosomal protein N' (replication factor Y)